MSTEYRRGIPSTAHVEAATRLGLSWEDDDVGHTKARWRLVICETEDVLGDYATSNTNYSNWDPGPLVRAPDAHLAYRPIRTDGTPVDWEALDAEVAKVGQQGQPTTVTPTAASAQPQGFRADLWRRICDAFFPHATDAGLTANDFNRVTGLDMTHLHMRSSGAWSWANAASSNDRTDILTRWAVYRELKPLYDIVDGAQGEVAMPRDVELAWACCVAPTEPFAEGWFLLRDESGLRARLSWGLSWRPEEDAYGAPLRNFAAVLDAVAERRVVERMRGQAQAPTVTAAQTEPVLDETALRALILNLPNVAAITNRIERGSRQRDRYIVRVRLVDPNVPLDRALAAQIPRNVHVHCNGHGAGGQRGVGGAAAAIFSPTGNREDAVAPPIQEPRRSNVEPRRFADVRPDRHGWRWWRQTGRDSTDLGQRFETLDGRCRWRSAHADAWFVPDTANPEMLRYTVIPTDEQGNPVSWEEAGFTAEAMRSAQETVQRAASDVTPARSVGDIIVDPTTGMVRSAHTVRIESPTPPRPGPLPRFTADELDDVDHSKTTKLDEVTLRRGKLPTVEQIAKYREVRARRTGSSVADALKESRIDCEVAQYVLERWAGGLGDADTVLLLRVAGCIAPLKDAPRYSIRAFDPKQSEVDRRSQDFLRTHNATLDTAEKSSPIVQRERQEAEERRQRLAELRQRLAAERAAQPPEMAKVGEVSRFDLIEPDPQADPAASIRAWEARQAAAKVRPVPVSPRIAKPAARPRRPAIEVVDAETDGLSRVEVVTALFGRAFNGGC